MTTTTGYKAVVISDLHLGMRDCKTKKILSFLNNLKTNLLILNGDIIDFDAMKRGSKWKKKHTSVLMKLLEISKTTEIIYIRGNHDDEVKDLYEFILSNIKFMDEYIYEHNYIDETSNVINKKILIFHGDKVDVTTKWKLLTQLGSIGYDLSLRINTYYNKIRELLGKPYHSISKVIKEQFKEALMFINNFENNACQYAKIKNCDSVICGHIHIPSIKIIDNINYYNSGDWVENFSALVLTENDEWKIIYE